MRYEVNEEAYEEEEKEECISNEKDRNLKMRCVSNRLINYLHASIKRNGNIMVVISIELNKANNLNQE